MVDVSKLRKDLIQNKIELSALESHRDELFYLLDGFLHDKEDNLKICEDLIMLYLDYYTYSEDGDVLITDHEYDMLMNWYIDHGGTLISRSDLLTNQTQWDFVKHESPGIVGTVKKIYTFEELVDYVSKYKTSSGIRKFRVAPKFDGISSAIKIDSKGRFLMGVTRNNGVEGQNITEVVRRAKNAKEVGSYYAFNLKKGETLWVKTELCISSEDFEKLVEEKEYANRRSATSGIVNSPKNLNLAKYITIIPLASHTIGNDQIDYVPLDSDTYSIRKPMELMDHIEKMFSKIRDSHYPFRTDGVVIYPLGDDIIPNYSDIMDDAIAYKVNTSQALTEVEYGYVSIGRLGKAVPMLHVKPVEINEICAHDASLGSFDKFASMDLHEHEQVLIYAAGDVIPQAKLPERRHYPANAPILHIAKRCPYCNTKLSRKKNTYFCENPECLRVSAGLITNFLVKLKVKNISDRTIEDLYASKLIREIPDLFTLTVSDISDLPGYGTDKAVNIVTELEHLKETPISVSTLLGSLGIAGISEKKAKKMLKVMPINKLLKGKKDQLVYELLGADNTGFTTAETFINFIHDNKKLIKKLMDIMNVTNDIEYKGNVVFTGFRNDDLEKKFNEIGYEVSSNVNGKTVVVVDASFSHDSTKCKAAERKGIDIVHVTEVDEVIHELKKK